MTESLTEKRKEEGFTLIELLIVIVILGILAAIVVFAVGSTGKNAAASACNADAKSLEVALESYNAQNGGYPPAQPTSPADTTNWAALTSSTASTNGPFLRAIPNNWQHYQVFFDTAGHVYVTGPADSSTAAYPATAAASNFDSGTGICASVAK